MNPFVQHNTFGETLHFVSHTFVTHDNPTQRIRERKTREVKKKKSFLVSSVHVIQIGA